MDSNWHRPKTQSELEAFVDLIIEGKFALEPPLRHLFFKGLGEGKVKEELKMTDDNSKRVDLVTLYFPYAKFRKILRRIDRVLLKNDTVLNILEAKGKKFQKSGNSEKVLRCLTLALYFAPKESLAIAGIYMKRAAIFVTSEKYELALMDVEMALRLDKPLELEAQLIEQKEICEAMIIPKVKREEDLMREEFKDQIISRVQGQYHQPLSVLPDFISVQFHPSKGRYLVTNIDLDPGTTVLVEEPFAAVVVGHLKWQSLYCHRCLRQMLNPIPCDGCVFFSYCDEKCRSDDHKHGGHEYECPLIPYAHAVKMHRSDQICLKAICRAGPDALKEFYDKSKSVTRVEDAWFVPVQDTHGNCNPYSQVLNMASHNRSSDLPHSALMAVSLAYALRIKTTFFDKIQESERLGFEKFIATVFLHHSESLPYNTVALDPVGFEIPDLCDYFENSDSRPDRQVGSAVYPAINLMNHSCAATVFREHLPGGRVAIITNRHLKVGEELSHGYGFDYQRMPLNERQTDLADYYRINCDCIACTENWPMFTEMDTDNMFRFVCSPCRDHILALLSRSSIMEIRDELFKCENCELKSHSSTLEYEPCSPFSFILDLANGLLINNRPLRAIPLLKEAIKFYQKDPDQPSMQLIMAQARLIDSYDLILNTVKDTNITTNEEDEFVNEESGNEQ